MRNTAGFAKIKKVYDERGDTTERPILAPMAGRNTMKSAMSDSPKHNRKAFRSKACLSMPRSARQNAKWLCQANDHV